MLILPFYDFSKIPTPPPINTGGPRYDGQKRLNQIYDTKMKTILEISFLLACCFMRPDEWGEAQEKGGLIFENRFQRRRY